MVLGASWANYGDTRVEGDRVGGDAVAAGGEHVAVLVEGDAGENGEHEGDAGEPPALEEDEGDEQAKRPVDVEADAERGTEMKGAFHK